ncbi:hypothetical protein [Bradyrhizobium sp. S3.5.5]|uniref:hypothetical protein n=1 Tax=Bradyrhizobium sp. S3.5.5 TaxID=3156430 RepID=UPI003397F669
MTTYTLHRTVGHDSVIIARGLSAVDAMHFIIEQEPTRSFQVVPEYYETFVRFDFVLWRDGSLESEGIRFHATVPLTYDYEADKSAALEIIAVQFLRIHHDYWDGQCDTDESVDEGLKYAADREDASRVEREIVAKFVDALAQDGYTVLREWAGNDFRLTDSSERAEFVEFAIECLVGDVTAYRQGEVHRFAFKFGDGWDMIKSGSSRLGALIETVIAPYRAKGRPAKTAQAWRDDTFGNLSKFLGEESRVPRADP